MSMIDRYRKKGGFVQLLNLIETTGKDKQEKFLKIIADEGPAWEVEIRKRLLTLDRILSWNPVYLAEIFPHVPAIQLAMVVGGLPPDKAELFMKVLTYKEKKGVEEILTNKKPSPGETSSGIMKLFTEIRRMEADGTLKFEKFAPEMVIPENIEEQLGKGISSPSLGFSKEMELQVASMAAPPTGTPSNVAEELTTLRRKLVQMTQENQKLASENVVMKEKLEQIKKIA